MQTPYGFLVDRFGARRFLVINTLVMSLAISAMGFATSYWQIVVLAGISGAANAVYHPADYTILAASIRPEKMGQAFAIHTFTGNAGFALAPPVVAVLASLFGWREALMIVGLVGMPVAAAIVWQSSILQDVAGTQKKKSIEHDAQRAGVRSHDDPVLLLLSPRLGGGQRRAGLADHHPASGKRHRAGARLFGAHRLHARHGQRHPLRRLGGRPLQALCDDHGRRA